jgi:DNA-binding response OmpR family regulator
VSGADVLLVEDDAHEAELVVRALGPRVRVLTAPDGDSALEMMLASPPRLVLLDLKMGGASGFEVLATVRGAPALASVPVVVLTSSSDPRDVARAYELGAHGYVVKPIVHARLVERLGAVTQFWLAAPADARDA